MRLVDPLTLGGLQVGRIPFVGVPAHDGHLCVLRVAEEFRLFSVDLLIRRIVPRSRLYCLVGSGGNLDRVERDLLTLNMELRPVARAIHRIASHIVVSAEAVKITGVDANRSGGAAHRTVNLTRLLIRPAVFTHLGIHLSNARIVRCGKGQRKPARGDV